MKLARVLCVMVTCASAGLLLENLPGSDPIWSWVGSKRITKWTRFSIGGAPVRPDSKEWTASWGRNRSVEQRERGNLSEIEVEVQHDSREGAVLMYVTGDSSAEVDAFISTIRGEFSKTYGINDGVMSRIAQVEYEVENGGNVYFWRQKYLWSLGGILLFSVIMFRALGKKARLSEGGSGDG